MEVFVTSLEIFGSLRTFLDIIRALRKILALSGEKCLAYRLKNVGRYSYITKSLNECLSKLMTLRKQRLHPFQAMLLMEPALISGFYSVKQMRDIFYIEI